jgi:multiple sugar transport system substrate-binding protein
MAVAAMALSATMMLAACGSDDDKDDSPPASGQGGNVPQNGSLKLVVADYGSGDGSTQKYWNGVISNFNAKYPGIKVDLQVINWDDIDKQVQTMVQNNQLPDLLQTGGYADKVADDLLYPVKDIMSDATRADFIDSFLPAATVDGEQYGIPFTSSTRQLIYNKDLFARAGITEPPKTWDELKADAEKLKAAGVQTPFGLPLGKEEAQGEFMNWMLGNGGGYKTGDKYTVNSQANVDTLNWINDNLVKTGLTEPNPGTKNRKDVYTEFYGGTVGMVNSNPTMLTQIKAKYPNLNFGTAAIPGRTGPLTETLGVCDWMMAFKKNGKKDQIKAFLDVAFNTDNQLKFQQENSFAPVTKSVMAKMVADPANAPLKPYIDLLPKARFYPLNDTAWDVLSPKIKEQLGLAVSGKSPKEVLDQLQKEAEAAVAQQK